MAHVLVSPAEFIACGNKCPCCWGPIEVVSITDKNVHINCPRCTWEDLACCIYGIKPEELPLASEAFPIQHIY